ncbi:MAG: dihydrolipoamide acetyltransferase family protein [Nitrospiria bacterium]
MAGRIVMPKLSDTMEEGVLVKWHKHEGQTVASGDVLAEVETDKAVLELEAYTDGILRKTLVAEGARVPVGTLLGVIAGESESIDDLLGDAPTPVTSRAGSQPEPSQQAPSSSGPPRPGPIPPVSRMPKASPLAKKLAEQRGIDLRTIEGTGPGGRIVERDLEAAPTAARTPERAPGESGDRTERLSLMRATIAKRMTESKTTVPHFYVTTEVDAGALIDLKAYLADTGEPAIGPTEFLVKAMGQALLAVPAVNASFAGDHVISHAGAHVGVAVAVDDGLITPVVRDADRLTLGQIAEWLADVVARARRKALAPEEYRGAGISLSNLGMYRVDDFAAIITPPEAAVLAVGQITQQAVVTDGQIVIGRRLRMTLSADHRVLDGVSAAKFLGEVAARLENPWRLIR